MSSGEVFRSGSHKLPAFAPISICAMAAVVPLAVRGNSCGHDFDFHLQSWFAVYQHWHQGNLYPHWIEAANYGAGEPRFVFYPPLSWALGALLGAIFSFAIGPELGWQAAPVAFTLIVLAASGLAMQRLAARWLPANAATLAACAYILNPYLLFVAYERSAYGELAAAVWLPLVVLFALESSRPAQNSHPERSAEGAQSKDLRFQSPDALGSTSGFFTRLIPARHPKSRIANPVPLSLAIAAIWLTNAPAAVMACYSLAALATWKAIAQKRYQPILKCAASLILGLGLAAFYLVPAAYERRWVDIARAIGPGMRIEDSFLFARTGESFHDQVLRTASWIFVTMLVTIFAASWIAWRRPRSRPLLKALLAATVVLAALQFPWSQPLWTHLPELKFLQFPWRWSLILGLPFALAIGFAMAPASANQAAESPRSFAVQTALTLIAAIGIVSAANRLFRQPCDDEDAVAAQLALFRSGSGFEGTDEYAALRADNSLIQQNLPLIRALKRADDETAAPIATTADSEESTNPTYRPLAGSRFAAQIQVQEWQPERKRFTIAAQAPGYAVLRLMDYPAWQVRANQTIIRDRPRRDDGLLAIPIRPGLTRIEVRYAATPDVLWGRALAAVSLLLLLVIAAAGTAFPNWKAAFTSTSP